MMVPTGFHCPTCKHRFTNVTITGLRVCCPHCKELMFTLPQAASRKQLQAALTDDYFKQSADQLEYFFNGWGVKRQQSRILLVATICAEVAARLPEDIAEA
mgnify:CR=1 FL=1